uniref:eukaryotic translation initiation factor 3 subunit C-like protein n=1 Tax=Pristiophorus japonicus TaxID=55135 RepID=UPI00398EDF53
MSRFFATGSDSESESSSSGDELVSKPLGTTFSKQPLLVSDDEEDTKRVVRSAKDKRFDELMNIIKTIRNAMKIRDMAKCLEEFEVLGKAYFKSKSIVDKEGIPKFYIRILVDLEDMVNEVWEDRDGRKKMNKNNSKALATMRQKIRKYNRDFESELTAYRENPEKSADEEEEVDEDEVSMDEEDDVEMSAAVFLKKKAEPIPDSKKLLKKEDEEDEDDDEDDEDWGTPSDDSDSESDDDDSKYTSLAHKFLKKQPTEEEKRAAEKKRDDKMKKRMERKDKKRNEEEDEEDTEGGEWKPVKGGAPMVSEKPKMFAKGTEINHAVVLKKLSEILQARGKKGTDRAAQIEMLTELCAIATVHNLGEGITLKIKFNIVASLYDYNPNLASCMKQDMWKKCLGCVDNLLDILFESPNIFIGENIGEDSENMSNAEQ